MKKMDVFEEQPLERLTVFLYLVPIFGVVPALWTLYRQRGSREQKRVSRMVLILAFGWLVGSLLLQTGGQNAETLTLPLLLMSSLLSSGYFLVNMWLMVQVWQRKPARLTLLERLTKSLR